MADSDVIETHDLTKSYRGFEAVRKLNIDRGRLVADTSLDQIRQEYRRITFGFSTDPPRVDFPGESIGPVRTDGRQVTVIAARNADAIIERVHHLGVASVETTPVSLRELFLAIVKEESRDALA